MSDIQTLESPDKELIKAIAWDIAKATILHIETMYPPAILATASTFRTSVRNTIFNEIMAAIEFNDAGKIRARLDQRTKWRRKYKKIWKENQSRQAD